MKNILFAIAIGTASMAASGCDILHEIVEGTPELLEDIQPHVETLVEAREHNKKAQRSIDALDKE